MSKRDPARSISDSNARWKGLTVHDRYRLGDMVGRGGMGEVYRAVDLQEDREVAFKTLRLRSHQNLDAERRFEAEVVASRRLNHPNIVRVLDTGRTEDGMLYMVLEFIKGQPLQHILKNAGRLSPLRAQEICSQILDGLIHAHAAGVIHRDLKPSNVMVIRATDAQGPSDRVKILDFGVAKVLDAKDDEGPTGLLTLTRAGEVLGTPSYMSPEQAQGQRVDARSDLFSCGSILYAMLSGRKPFEAPSPMGVLHQIVSASPQPLRHTLSTINPALEAIVETAMAKDLDARFQSATEMKAALDGLARTEPSELRTSILSETTSSTRYLGGASSSFPHLSQTGNSFSDGRPGPQSGPMASTASARSLPGRDTPPLLESDSNLRSIASSLLEPPTVRGWLLLGTLGVLLALGVAFFPRSEPALPSLNALFEAFNLKEFEEVEDLGLEGYSKFRQRLVALRAIQNAMKTRREHELPVLEGAFFDPKLTPAAGTLQAWFESTDAEGAPKAFVLEVKTLKQGTFEGMLRPTRSDHELRIVGYHQGNHLLFRSSRTLVDSDGDERRNIRYEKYSGYVVGDRIVGFWQTSPPRFGETVGG